MKYIVISDVHNRTDLVEKICEKYENDYTIIFLGDYFDQFHDGRSEAEKTARWLKYSLQKKKRIHLLGNHDAAYAFSNNKATWCPGWEVVKNTAIRSIMNQSDFDQLKLYHYIEEGNWLLSHAGFTLPNLFGFRFRELLRPGGKFSEVKKYDRSYLLHYLKSETKKFFFAAKNNHYHHFMFQGSRMGEYGNGGPFWLSIENFFPIIHFNQIVGHTPLGVPAPCYLPNKKDAVSTNWFMDTHNNHAAFIENGVVSFHKIKDLLAP